MIVKKFKKTRGAEDGTIQVKLRNSLVGVVLEVVDADGKAKHCGNLLLVSEAGVMLCAAIDKEFGFKLEARSKLTIK